MEINMKGSECKLIYFVGGSKKYFIIPVYQRHYDWEEANCKKMFDDLVNVIKYNRKTHFFGTVSSVVTGNGIKTELLIIDGHQRLTTLSLLFLAMHNLLKKGILTSKDNNLSSFIMETYLIDKWDDRKLKLKLVRSDVKAYDGLFHDEYDKSSNITRNYNYFYNRIQKQEISIDQLFEAIGKLEIINVQAQEWDDPQLIFESLNATGLALSEGDKIRNFVLMGLPTRCQEQFYNNYWLRIENYCNQDLTNFVRDYLTVKNGATPAYSKIYSVFKDYVFSMKEQETVKRTEILLKDMMAYAEDYKILLTSSITLKGVSYTITRLNKLEATVTRPFFLEVLKLWRKEEISDDDLAKIFYTVESYLFRRLIVDLPTNMLNKIFATLHNDIMKFEDGDYFPKLNYVLLSKQERSRFPSDDEFIQMLSTRNIYNMSSKNRIYILDRFENFDTLEGQNVYKRVEEGILSIEHIMPQHLTPAWIEALGSDYEQIQKDWLHRLANLTLIAYNSQYSNLPFQDKKMSIHGFAKSGLRINKFISDNDKWTLEELEARNKHLMEQALEIWRYPTEIYVPKIQTPEYISLDDDFDLTGKQISGFEYKNTLQPVKTWSEMFASVMRLLHSEDKSVLSRLAFMDDKSVELCKYVSASKVKFIKALEIEQGIYVENNTSTSQKLSILRKFFKVYGVDPSELVFYLKGTLHNLKQEEFLSDKLA